MLFMILYGITKQKCHIIMSAVISQVAEGGRIVIPAEIRRQMGIKPGDEVILSCHDGELHIATRKLRLQQAKALVQAYAGQQSLSAQLLADRKAEADG
jgi:AbrB family looped-hinge helix DNA binding protein